MFSRKTSKTIISNNVNKKRRRTKSETDINNSDESKNLDDQEQLKKLSRDNSNKHPFSDEKENLSVQEQLKELCGENNSKPLFSDEEDTSEPTFDEDFTDCEEESPSSDEDDSVDDCSSNLKKNHDTINHLCPVIREKLRHWAIKFTVIHAIITALLLILKPVFPCLPSSAKNLIKTENKFVISSFSPENAADKSEFMYIGLAEQLKRIINPKNNINEVLQLQFNIDGLPLFGSGGKELWPLLGRVHFCSNLYETFVIAAYSGVGKPILLNRFFQNLLRKLIPF